LRSGEEGVEKGLFVGRGDRPAKFTGETTTRPGGELPGVCLAEGEDLRDLPVRVVERFSQQVGGTFGGRQLLEQDAHRELERFALLRLERGIGCLVDRVDKLRFGVHLSAGPGGLGDVDRQPRRCRGEERGGVSHLGPVGVLPADPGVLHDVLRFACASEHPVGDAEQPRTHGVERCGVELGDLARAHEAARGESTEANCRAGRPMDACPVRILRRRRTSRYALVVAAPVPGRRPAPPRVSFSAAAMATRAFPGRRGTPFNARWR
jgi:hypothetical protein